MSVYVDIDMDYLINPVKKDAINNIRLYKNDYCTVSSVTEFINKLNARGLLNSCDKKFFTNHKKSYIYWWMKHLTDMTIIHVDAHSDLYRNRNKDLRYLTDTDMNCDDYIWYAIREGFVSKLYWVIPDGLYNLNNMETAANIIPRGLILNPVCRNNIFNGTIDVITKLGPRMVEYYITTLDNLPSFCSEKIEMITTATSPEFYPEMADEEVFKGLRLIGADDSTIGRIKKTHMEMGNTQPPESFPPAV